MIIYVFYSEIIFPYFSVFNCFFFHISEIDFSDFRYGSRSSHSTTDPLTVVSDRIARAFKRSGATRSVALGISKTFDRIWHAGLLNLNLIFETLQTGVRSGLLISVLGKLSWLCLTSLITMVPLM